MVGIPTNNDSKKSSEAGDRVVISGMSGIYPQSHNVAELADILYNKVIYSKKLKNPISSGSSRWSFDHPELTEHLGTAPGLERFDAQFFKVFRRLGNNMDAVARKVLEQAYQAIYDAGVNPVSLDGKKVAVFVGTCFSDAEKACFYVKRSNGMPIAGCNRSMFSNRVSYWLNTRGQSVTVDESCCSSTAALKLAFQSLHRGDAEAAIVAGGSICLHPHTAIMFGRTLKYSKDGKTRSFDVKASGCSRSDGINVLFLQKASQALRNYAEVVYATTQFINLENDKTRLYRDPEKVAKYLNGIYKKINVSPQSVEYVEAFGCGDPDADKAELEALDKVFCKDRSQPLYVGSVMSNIGYLESASGIASITKVLLGYQTGVLAGNLHCNSPRTDVPALRDGRMQITTDHQPFNRSYVAVNGMSVSGINSHVLLHGNYKPKDLSCYKSAIPHLITLSGRQESAVWKIINNLRSQPVDQEMYGLLHNINEYRVPGHLARGYVILNNTDDENSKTAVSLSQKVGYYDDANRPLWFVYSGMGSQWVGMGVHLMRIPTFAAAIKKCQAVLKPKGVDVLKIITSDDKSMFDNILNSFVGIAAIQIGLTDILKELGLTPDKIIGHSVGELGCAYADGCFTAEEMIMAAYSRGLVSLQTPLIRGSMAAVGLGYQEIIGLCPRDIEVACHNASNSCTISGPADSMKAFVAELTKSGIFAREVACSNIAYHSKYIADAGPGLLKYLKEVIKNPKPRSDRWLSTSVPMDRWHEDSAKYSSAEYHTNNLLNPVLFEETASLIPPNAVLLEVAPHGLLQAILKRSLPETCTNIPLTSRFQPEAKFLLEAIGQLYMIGFNPKIKSLYPKINYPVSTGTPMLSHLVEWAHQEKWYLPLYISKNNKMAAATNNVISIHDAEHKYLQGNVIRGHIQYPFAAALVAVWDTLAMTLGVERRQLPVQFQEVELHAQPSLHDRRQLRLKVALQRGSGRFEVLDDFSKVASGFIFQTADKTHYLVKPLPKKPLELQSTDIYQKLFIRDYSYKGDFRSIHSADELLNEALIKWTGNWVTFIDGLIQLNALRHPHTTVSQPDYIGHISISIRNHGLPNKVGSEPVLVTAEVAQDYTRCGGVTMGYLKFRNLPVFDDRKMDCIQKSVSSIKSQTNHNGSDSYEPLCTDLKGDIMLRCGHSGDLNTLHWAKTTPAAENGIEVKVHYAGVNDLDVKRASGAVPYSSHEQTEAGFGMNFSGVTKSGVRVMGLVQQGALRSRLHASTDLLWPVPAQWSLEDAATVPLAYCLAYYCLCMKSSLFPGMKILVHGGAGSLGQAAISLALSLDCEVFTTVSDVRKKRMLLKIFPNLKAENVGNSRDESFAFMVMEATNGNGVDLILNTMKGNLKTKSIYCGSRHSVAIDVVQILHRENYYLGMGTFFNTSYVTADIFSIFKEANRDQRKELQRLVSAGIARGFVRPLTRVTCAPGEAPRAFRLHAAPARVGAVLLRLRDAADMDIEECLQPSPESYQVIVNDDDCMLGQLAERLIKRGARKLNLLRLKPTLNFSPEIRKWEAKGIDVNIISIDNKETRAHVFSNGYFSGLVDAVYVWISAGHDDHEIADLMENLDKQARRHQELKHFVVINSHNSAGIETCIARQRDSLPATMVKLPRVLKLDDESTDMSQAINIREAVNTVERVASSAEAVVVAQIRNPPLPSLVHQIAAVAEITIPSNCQAITTLGELQVDAVKLDAVQRFLRDKHNILLRNEEIADLTIEKILTLEKELLKEDFDQVKGLRAFFSTVDPDELEVMSEMIFLPTLASGAKIENNEFDARDSVLVIVPGVEGHHGRFLTLCERLKLPALLLQPGLDRRETVPRMAARLSQVLIDKIGLRNNFNILGYESGALVALEMAAILESKGLIGTVFYVGSAPSEFKLELKEHLTGLDTEEALKNAVLQHMYSLMLDGEKLQVNSELPWDERVEVTVRALLGRVSHSAQYTRKLIKTAYDRISLFLTYEALERNLRSKLVLLWPSPSTSFSFESAVKSLQRHSERPISAYSLRAPLSHATQDLRCAAIINESIDQRIVNDFDSKNHCETYVIDANAFTIMTED